MKLNGQKQHWLNRNNEIKQPKMKKTKKSKKKIFPEYPGFELGNSDPIANHITTRPRGIERNRAKILQLS